jgi:hypothetical protein
MKLLLRHDRGELGPKTIEEWAAPNGDECLLIYMLRSIEEQGIEGVELVAVEEAMPGYYVEVGA